MERTVGRKPGVSAWGYAWLAAAGTWTRIRVSAGLDLGVGKMSPWGSGAWRVGWGC